MNSTLITLTRLSLKPVQRPPPLVQVPRPPDIPSCNQEFHLFPNLPAELRLQVWKTILLTPRTITVIQIQGPRNRRRFVSSSGPPALLSTNREARSVALSLPHQEKGRLNYIFSAENTKLYCNPAIDILYLNESCSPCSFVNHTPLRDVLRIKRLAVQDTELKELGYYFQGSSMFNILGLEELVVVFDGEPEGGVHCEKCRVARREIGGKVGWRVPTWTQWYRMGKGDEQARAGRAMLYRQILGAWVKGGALWEWVWGAVHEGF